MKSRRQLRTVTLWKHSWRFAKEGSRQWPNVRTAIALPICSQKVDASLVAANLITPNVQFAKNPLGLTIKTAMDFVLITTMWPIKTTEVSALFALESVRFISECMLPRSLPEACSSTP